MSPVSKLGLGTLCALLAAILTIAVWPASEADKARDDGEQLGQAVSALYEADSADEVDAALADLDGQFDDTRGDAPEVEQAFWDGFDSGLTTTT